jgi:hypothetical protein
MAFPILKNDEKYSNMDASVSVKVVLGYIAPWNVIVQNCF